MNEKKIDVIRAQKFPMRICDIVIFAVAVTLTVVLLLTVPRRKGAGVEIVYENTRIVLPLISDTVQTVGNHLTVTVQDGLVWVTESDCKNRICVKTGKIGRIGESIVCAQNGIVITIVGNSGLAGTVGQG